MNECFHVDKHYFIAFLIYYRQKFLYVIALDVVFIALFKDKHAGFCCIMLIITYFSNFKITYYVLII